MADHHDQKDQEDRVRTEDDRRRALLDRLQTLGQMASTETARFHQVAAASLGLGVTDLKALSVLLLEGPMTAGQLARRLSLTTGAVTNVLDHLQQRDFVRRASDPQDRRKVIVAVNRERLPVTDAVYRSMGEAFEQLLGTYSTEQLEFLAQYLQASIALTRHEIAKLAAKNDTERE